MTEPCPGPAPQAPVALPAANRDEQAFAALYAEHAQAVFYFALRFLGDPTQAEDAAHDVFLRAWRNFQDFRGDARPRTWLYRITLNHCQNLQKSWSHRHLATTAEADLFDRQPNREPGPLQVLENVELGQRIQQTLGALPADYRTLLLLIADEQLSYDEAAAITGLTPDAVRGKLYRARKAFAAEFNRRD